MAVIYIMYGYEENNRVGNDENMAILIFFIINIQIYCYVLIFFFLF